MAAVYLEEFAPKNRWTDIIEVNINNLAAVPSIVFGLWGLAVFLNFFGLPRSAPLVGGMVFALMTLPTIIIASARGTQIRSTFDLRGCSRRWCKPHAVVTDHVVQLAMPGMLTGTIIGMARALGETAPSHDRYGCVYRRHSARPDGPGDRPPRPSLSLGGQSRTRLRRADVGRDHRPFGFPRLHEPHRASLAAEIRKALVMSELEHSLEEAPSDAQSSNDSASNAKIAARGVDVFYSGKQALFEIDLDIGSRAVTSLIGPSGCGKSTFLRCMNRMNDVIDGCEVTGSIELDGQNIYSRDVDVVQLRAMVGMVFQKPNPFPKSIYDNVAYGPRIHGLVSGSTETDEIVEQSLRRAGLWEEVKERLQEPGTGLSGGQQQRLCIARAIAVSPQVILMDEPCSALDPIATARI